MANTSVIIKTIAIAICQLVIATAGVAISTAIFYFSVKPVLSIFVSQASLATNLPLRMRFFPLQTIVGWITGYIVVRNHTFGDDRSSRYVWIIPAIWFTLFFVAWSHGSLFVENRWDRFFFSNAPASKTEQLVTTLPLFTSLAYAFGGYFRVRQGRNAGDRSITAPTVNR